MSLFTVSPWMYCISIMICDMTSRCSGQSFGDVSNTLPTQDEIQLILERHNSMRRQEGAANMNQLVS